MLDLGHFGAEAGEGLGQLGADRAASDDDDAARQFLAPRFILVPLSVLARMPR